jgi:hypothetical protein
MSLRKGLVLDHLILLAAILPESEVLPLLIKYESTTDFRTPEICFETVARTLSQTLLRRDVDPAPAHAALRGLDRLVEPIGVDVYEACGSEARERVAGGNSVQWPVVAVALLFESPIWTKQEDFFGAGIATWTTKTVELYLR